MSNWLRFIKGASVYVVSSVINASIPFFLLPVLTRYLTPAEYGEVAMFGVWASFAGAICGLNVHAAVNRKYFDLIDDQEEFRKFIFTSLLILIISFLFFISLVFIFSFQLGELFSIQPAWLLWGTVLAGAQFIIQIRLGQWQVREKPIYFGLFQISQSLINIGLSLVAVVLFTLGVTGRISAIVAATVTFSVLAVLLLLKDDLIKPCWRPDLIKDALKFGTPLVPHTLGAFLLLSADRLIITNLLGIDAAGVYLVALQFGLVVSLLVDAVNKAFSPWLYNNLKIDTEEAKLSTVKVTYCLYSLLIIGAAMGFVIGPIMVEVIVGPEFKIASNIVGWLIFGQALRGAYLFVTNYIFFSKRTEFVALITVFTGILNLSLLYVLANRLGLLGVAYAMCLSMLVQWILTWLISSRLIKMPWCFFITKSKIK